MKIRRLSVRLFLSYLIVLLVGIGVLWVVTLLSLPGAYGHQMHRMDPSPMGSGMGMGQANGMGTVDGIGIPVFANFRNVVNEAFAYAFLATLVVAALVSLLVSNRLAKPLRAMMVASQRIAQGRYGERIPAAGSDELGQLAGSFNHMAEKLEQTETMRRQLIGDVAHELRTPLTAIKGSMEGLVDGILPASPETFSQIGLEAERLSGLVDDLQELSRVEARAFILDLKLVFLPELVKTVFKRLSGQSGLKNIALTSSMSADLPALQADEDRLLQILMNLIGNALNYTPVGGRVNVSAETNGNQMVVRVTDNGCGISAEALPHIFDRFYREDKSRSRQAGGGSGIGLTITRHLVEAHGGIIMAESEGEGKGSTFTIHLPLGQGKPTLS
jgi:two-component system sensor histidine kinase BaeS